MRFRIITSCLYATKSKHVAFTLEEKKTHNVMVQPDSTLTFSKALRNILFQVADVLGMSYPNREIK